jgi:hypothetical protein
MPKMGVTILQVLGVSSDQTFVASLKKNVPAGNCTMYHGS